MRVLFCSTILGNIMDVENVTVLQQLYGHGSDVTSCDFTPNFTLVTGSRWVCINLKLH